MARGDRGQRSRPSAAGRRSRRLIDEQTAARLAHLERRLATERLTIAFVAEYSRGKSELINALFFADLGRAPAARRAPGRTTLCPTEILFDPARPPSIRVLPIETRESAKSLREYIAEIDTWKEIALDPAHPESLAAGLRGALRIAARDRRRGREPRARAGRRDARRDPALALRGGQLPAPAARERAHDPRHARPRHARRRARAHPEPRARRRRDRVHRSVPTPASRAPTARCGCDHIAPIGSESHTRFIVLNKIDALRDGRASEAEVLSEIDRQVRAAAEALGVDPTRIFALSAQAGPGGARRRATATALMKSRLYRLEQALSQGLLHRRRHDHATVVRAETRSVLAETRALLESRHAFASDQVRGAHRPAGQEPEAGRDPRAQGHRRSAARQEEARATMAGLRTVHNRQVDELSKLLDPDGARERGDARARGHRLERLLDAASARRSTPTSATRASACAVPSTSSPR